MNNNTLKYWLVNTPIFFAITSFLCAITVSVLGGLLLPNSGTTVATVGTLTVITTVISAILAIRRLKTSNMDRTSLVTIFNTVMITVALMSLISFITLIQFPYLRIWLYHLMQSTIGMIFAFTIALCILMISLYVFGMIIVGLWAKILRARTMNIPLWKIICSIPFGFDMMWIPGYFISTKQDKKPTVKTQTNWIVKLTQWTMAHPVNSGFMFTSLIFLNGIFNGLSSTLLTLSLLMLFGIWAIQVGAKKFEKNIGGAYATIAVIFNLIMIAYMCLIIYLH